MSEDSLNLLPLKRLGNQTLLFSPPKKWKPLRDSESSRDHDQNWHVSPVVELNISVVIGVCRCGTI